MVLAFRSTPGPAWMPPEELLVEELAQPVRASRRVRNSSSGAENNRRCVMVIPRSWMNPALAVGTAPAGTLAGKGPRPGGSVKNTTRFSGQLFKQVRWHLEINRLFLPAHLPPLLM